MKKVMSGEELVKAFQDFVENLSAKAKDPSPPIDTTPNINTKVVNRLCERIEEAARGLQRSLGEPGYHKLAARLESIEATCQAHQVGLQNVYDKIMDAFAEREVREFIYTRIDHLDVSTRIKSCLQAEKINVIGDVCGWCERCLMRIPNLGRKSVREIEALLKVKHYKFANDYNCSSYLHHQHRARAEVADAQTYTE